MQNLGRALDRSNFERASRCLKENYLAFVALVWGLSQSKLVYRNLWRGRANPPMLFAI